ncbi:MAG: hypothetical protein HQM11_08855 [SAR324 cluster bacterium]|nr:hypothetical protein [SAR324 cluster bacterium]
MRAIQRTQEANDFLNSLKIKEGTESHRIAIVNRYRILAKLHEEQIMKFPGIRVLNSSPLIISFRIDYRELERISIYDGYEAVCLISDERLVVVKVEEIKVS